MGVAPVKRNVVASATFVATDRFNGGATVTGSGGKVGSPAEEIAFTDADDDRLPNVPVMVAVPAETPCARPPALTSALLGLELTQLTRPVTSLVLWSENVAVPRNC
jgi:hypothetical protein